MDMVEINNLTFGIRIGGSKCVWWSYSTSGILICT